MKVAQNYVSSQSLDWAGKIFIPIEIQIIRACDHTAELLVSHLLIKNRMQFSPTLLEYPCFRLTTARITLQCITAASYCPSH